MTIDHFSPAKKALQRLGSWVVRQASQTDGARHDVGLPRLQPRGGARRCRSSPSSPTRWRRSSRPGKMTVAIDHVPVRTNPKLRESRLFPSMWTYIRRNGVSIFRIYALYEPLRVFMTAALRRRAGGAGGLGALPVLLDRRRRRRPRAVADPRRGAVQRRDGARRARRARRPDQRPADHAAADLRARAADRARARRPAVALRARRARPAAASRRPARTPAGTARPRTARRSSCERDGHARRRGHGHRQHLRQVRLLATRSSGA